MLGALCGRPEVRVSDVEMGTERWVCILESILGKTKRARLLVA